jgi:hypothetical protein
MKLSRMSFENQNHIIAPAGNNLPQRSSSLLPSELKLEAILDKLPREGAPSHGQPVAGAAKNVERAPMGYVAACTVLAVYVQVYTELFLREAVFKAAHIGLLTKSTTKSERRNCLMSRSSVIWKDSDR